jgi:hypothetical protein
VSFSTPASGAVFPTGAALKHGSSFLPVIPFFLFTPAIQMQDARNKVSRKSMRNTSAHQQITWIL